MENKDIEIVEEEKEGISIGDIFKKIWHAKITLGVSFVVILVLGVFGIHYLYTKPNQIYTGSVTYQFKGSTEGLYPNGTTFDYRTMIEPEQLETIKNSKEEYANIDIDKMLEKNAISVSLLTGQATNENGETVTVDLPNYVSIQCSASYFDNETQAKNFLKDVLDAPNYHANSLYDAIDFESNLTLANVSLTYEDQIDYLILQRDLVIENYEELSSVFGRNAYTDKNNTSTITQTLTSIKSFFTTNNLSSLQTLATNEQYVKSKQEGEITQLTNELNRLVAEYNSNSNQINNLQTEWDKITNSGSTIISSPNDFLTAIYELTTANSKLYDRIETLSQKLGYTLSTSSGKLVLNKNEGEQTYKEATPEFKTQLNTITTNLTAYTEQLQLTTEYLYTNYAKPIYTLTSVVEISGGLNIILNGAISFVVAAILACVIAGIKGNIDIKNEEKNKQDVLEEEAIENK